MPLLFITDFDAEGGAPPAELTSGEAETAIATGSETELIVRWDSRFAMVMLHGTGISNTSSLTYRIQLSINEGVTFLAGTNYDFAVRRDTANAGTVTNGTDRIGATQAGGGEDVGFVIWLPFPGDNARQLVINRHKNQQETGGSLQAGYGAARTSGAAQINAARLYRSDGSALNSGAAFSAIILGPPA